MFLLGIFGTALPYFVGLIVYIIIMLQIGNAPTNSDSTPPFAHSINVTDERISHESAKAESCYHYTTQQQDEFEENHPQTIVLAPATSIEFQKATTAFISSGYSSNRHNKAPPVA